jgi:cytochrome c556
MVLAVTRSEVPVRHSLRITVLFLAAVLVALAAGCGGGSSPSSAGQTQQTTTQQQMTTQQTSTAISCSNFASAKNCLAFAGVAAKIASAMAPTTSGGTQAAFQAEVRNLQAFADAAPSEVKADFQTFATAFSGYLQALQQSGYKLGSSTPPTASQMAAIVQATKAFDTSKLKAAEKHLQSWASANCK